MQNILLSGEKSLGTNCIVLLPRAVGSVPGVQGCPKLVVTAPTWGGEGTLQPCVLVGIAVWELAAGF